MDTILNYLPVWCSPECFGGEIYQDGDGSLYFHKDKISYGIGEYFYDDIFGALMVNQIDLDADLIQCIYGE